MSKNEVVYLCIGISILFLITIFFVWCLRFYLKSKRQKIEIGSQELAEQIQPEKKSLPRETTLNSFCIEKTVRTSDPTASYLFAAPNDISRETIEAPANGKPHYKIRKLQVAYVDKMLSRLGVEYIPAQLLSLLYQYPAVEALNRFLELLGLSFQEVCKEPFKRGYFKGAINILVDSDAYRCDVKLSEKPLFSAIKKSAPLCDLDEVKRVAAHFENVASIARYLENGHAILLAHYVFLGSAKSQLMDWDNLSPLALFEIRMKHDAYLAITRNYGEKKEALESYFHALGLLDAANKSKWKSHQDRSADIEKSLLKSNKLEEIEIHLNDYSSIADEVQKVVKQFKASPNKQWRSKNEDVEDLFADAERWNRSSEEDRIRYSLKVLGLPYADDLDLNLIKKAFRKKSKQCHSDVGGDDEKQKRVNHAYLHLKEVMRSSQTVM